MGGMGLVSSMSLMGEVGVLGLESIKEPPFKVR